MRASTLPVAFVAAATAAGGASAAAANTSTAAGCANGLHILLARGTGEKPDTSKANKIAEGIMSRIPNSNLVAVDYPATLSNPTYRDSVRAGIISLKSALIDYHSTCPDGKTAVIGYSQGAQVSTYTFCGGNGTEIVSSEVTKNVVAILEFGDPSHVANATYNRGNSTNDGIFALEADAVQRCEAFGDRLRSYCDLGDNFCDRGSVVGVHGTYFDTYMNETVDYVVDRYKRASDQSSATISVTGSATTGVGGQASATGDVGGSAPGLRPGNDGMLYTAPLAVWVVFQLL